VRSARRGWTSAHLDRRLSAVTQSMCRLAEVPGTPSRLSCASWLLSMCMSVGMREGQAAISVQTMPVMTYQKRMPRVSVMGPAIAKPSGAICTVVKTRPCISGTMMAWNSSDR